MTGWFAEIRSLAAWFITIASQFASGVDGRIAKRRLLTAIGLVPVAQVQHDASWSLRFD
jgi:hypothetical protein